MQFLYTNWMLVLIMIMSGTMLIYPLIQRRISGMTDVGNVRLTHLLNREGATALDIRETKEMDGTKLIGAVHIPLSQLKERAASLSLDKSKPVVVYCARGQRGPLAASDLKAAGFTQIFNLTGGFKAWTEAGLPVEKV
ncbi:MAG TPA: rhodanese-like domain-containing protein [Casimicrobium sp.]|jgi:rhodanese-related sulfurtransferase|nr:rhodanese-like domain-containing protein [Casimicrobium sp.]